ncbi:MAG: DUF4271 domain-containing protein [Bacteroidetes bacterium]|nr:DUF4271 domain-containing protein [Bacteroidota bacterium]
MKFRYFLCLLLCFSITGTALGLPRPAPQQQAEPEGDIVVSDSGDIRYVTKHHPFKDSLLTDTLRTQLFKPFTIRLPESKLGRQKDPFDPFVHPTYYRVGMGKFWFFVVSLIILGLMLYYRNAFPKQFNQRLRGIFNEYYFKELLSDFSLSFASGSIVAAVFTNMVLAQLFVLVVLYFKFVQLNLIIFYVLVLLAVFAWKGLLFLLQGIQAWVLNLGETTRQHTQRHINVDTAMSLLVFPLVNVLYYNSGRLQGFPVGAWLAGLFILWVAVRILIEFFTMIRERGTSVAGILYFCAFEILPHAVLITALLRTYQLK